MKDVIFAIYRYRVSKMEYVEGDLFPDGKLLTPKNYATPELFFESFFPDKGMPMDMWEEKKKSTKDEDLLEKDPHNTIVREHRDHIILLGLQANGSKKIYDEDWGDHSEPNHQPCLMLFDNRPGHQFVAIEHAAMGTDKSAKIIEDTFHNLLTGYGYKFEILRLKRDLPFLEAVYDIKDTLKDNVNKVVFDFVKNGDAKKQLDSTFLKALDEWVGKFADSGQVAANIKNDELLKDTVIRQDLELMADLCKSNPNYNLLVKFEHFGLFRYGQDVRAQYGVESDILESFVCPTDKQISDELFPPEETVSKITLPEWLCKVQQLYLKYDEEALSVKKRTRRNRR